MLVFYKPLQDATHLVANTLKKLQTAFKAAEKLTIYELFLIESDRALSQVDLEKLSQLIPNITRYDHQFLQPHWIVTPRRGTISAWSSKATDILQHCHLENIQRIERGLVYDITASQKISVALQQELAEYLYDPMTESCFYNLQDLENLFQHHSPAKLTNIELLQDDCALQQANVKLGLALSHDEIDYLNNSYRDLKRNPSDAELMMFAQANSEHCRHKIFNAHWIINGEPQPDSLFAMIKHTKQHYSENILSAYHDNAAIINGALATRFYANQQQCYVNEEQVMPILMKVETHNHPTAIAPYPGAATGSGGEIRDEAACGRGGLTKAGLVGFAVSHLNLPDLKAAWEYDFGKPPHVSSALQIMLEAPIGAASFNNEFGRPNLCGYFRSFNLQHNNQSYGYHKPIMLAGGMGNIQLQNCDKKTVTADCLIIVLGGPAMQIGLGGGAASSLASGQSDRQLDFSSVQRSNPEMQRRAQQVIISCVNLGDANPILSIHDVGAGGLSNAIPEILQDNNLGGVIELRAIPNADLSMSPLAIWCNEAQERYVLATKQENIAVIEKFAKRERCPIAVVGKTRHERQLTVSDQQFNNQAVDIPMSLLFGNTPPMLREVKTVTKNLTAFDHSVIDLTSAIKNVLQHPSVADKSFLITIGDRSVGGLTVRDQMVGPWQVPVADVAVTASDFVKDTGEAMALGERPPLALINPAASVRIAVAEAITNIFAANIAQLSDIKLSANWMAACGDDDNDLALFEGVKAVSQFCQALNIAIPVGKDSLSMRMQWQDDNGTHNVVSPLSLNISAFAPVANIHKTLTPQLQCLDQETVLVLIDLSSGQQRLGGSIFLQCYQQLGHACPDIASESLINFAKAMIALQQQNLILAYHDRSDGGLLATLAEMVFCSHTGLKIDISVLGHDALASLFNEEIGVVLQVKQNQLAALQAILKENHLNQVAHVIAKPATDQQFSIRLHDQIIYQATRIELQQVWSRVSQNMQCLRDNTVIVKQEAQRLSDENDRGLYFKYDFKIKAPALINKTRPKVAILREQGVNGHVEMAAAFDLAGFSCVDVHMQDLINGDAKLADFYGLVACGGFSYGDVLNAGRGWAATILFNQKLRQQFQQFFARENTFTLGVCNGCQMLAYLGEIIPGATHFPRFVKNDSQQFESRLVMVQIEKSPSLFFKDMHGAQLPIVVAHGEGKVKFEKQLADFDSVSMRYIDLQGHATTTYPYNPNGSQTGITAITSRDGRVLIMMPHPERVILNQQFSWSDQSGRFSPWLKMFYNARAWVG